MTAQAILRGPTLELDMTYEVQTVPPYLKMWLYLNLY
jgi:hypothetical protein